MGIKIINVKTKSDLNKFILLPWEIYKDDKNWVPPLIKDAKKNLKPFTKSIINITKQYTNVNNDSNINNNISSNISQKDCELFLALINGKPVARVFVGINNYLNERKNAKLGYFSLFECIDEIEVAKALFDRIFTWFREKEISTVIGPVSIDGSDMDENKGLLVNSFHLPPVIMTSYNPEYYIKLFDSYGFKKFKDVFAYYMESDKLFAKNPEKVLNYAKKKYNFRVDTINLNILENELEDIKYILDLAIPEEWEDLTAPDIEEIRALANGLVDYIDPDIVLIARTNDNKPIGFSVSIPDYNQVLKHLNGRITPLSILKFFKYKKKINCARALIMFVIPEFRKKGVSFALYHQSVVNGMKKGYTWAEGSTIGEDNIRMRTDIESIGAVHYKTYRIFKWDICH